MFRARFGDKAAATPVKETSLAYEGLGHEIPYIGGKGDMFTEWFNYSAFNQAMYQVLSALRRPEKSRHGLRRAQPSRGRLNYGNLGPGMI